MSDEAIYDACAVRLGQFAAQFSPALPVAYPNVGAPGGGPFVPPSAGRWLELVWIPNRSQNYGLADDGPTLMQGLAQVNVCERPGVGIVEGLKLARQVVQHFNKGTRLDIARVYVKPSISNVIQEPARIFYAVTISWRGFVNG